MGSEEWVGRGGVLRGAQKRQDKTKHIIWTIFGSQLGRLRARTHSNEWIKFNFSICFNSFQPSQFRTAISLRSIKSISAIISLMFNMKTRYAVSTATECWYSAQAGSRGGQCHRRGGGRHGWAGLCVLNEGWQETLPAPNYLHLPLSLSARLHTHVHSAHIQTPSIMFCI